MKNQYPKIKPDAEKFDPDVLKEDIASKKEFLEKNKIVLK